MPPKRTFYRRVNKHIKTLHCECNKSYTRADHFERHKSVCGHTSEYVAASEPLPESSPDSSPFYCSCGAGFTAADAFLRHRNRTGHDGNWVQSRYQPRGHSAVPITAESPGDLIELTGAREIKGLWQPPSRAPVVFAETKQLIAEMVAARCSDFNDSGLGVSIKGYRSNSPRGEDPVAFPASDLTISDVGFSTQHEPSVNIIETSSETTDVAVVPEEQGTNINEDQEQAVSSVVETNSLDKDDVAMHQSPEETESLTSTKIDRTDLPTGEENEPNMVYTQGGIDTVDAMAKDTVPDDVDRTDNNTNDHSSPDTVVPQQDQAPTTDSSTGPAQQTPRIQKIDSQSLKSLDPLRKSKNAGISKDRSPKRGVKRSNKNFLKKHCSVLSSVTVGLLAAGYCALAGCNMFTAATSSREWVVDSTALQHIVKDGNSFHNKGSLYEECDWARKGWSCDWNGRVQLTFDNGKKLMLEDVSYQPGARSNVVSLNKLGASSISGFWNQNEIAVYNETSSEMVGKAVWGKSAYTLDGLVKEKTTSPSTAPVTATSFSQSEITPSSTISTSSQATHAITLKRSARPWRKSPTSSAPSSTTASPARSSTTTTVPTLKHTKTAAGATAKPWNKHLPTSACSVETTILDAAATARNPTLNSTKAIAAAGEFSPYDLLKFLPGIPSIPKLPIVRPDTTPVQSTSNKKRRLDDATQSPSKKARTSSDISSSTSQTAPTSSSWSGWWPIAVPQVPWPKSDISSANATIPVLAPSATAEPSTEDSSSSSAASWFGSFGKLKRVDAYQYMKEKLAEAKSDIARENEELRKELRGVKENCELKKKLSIVEEENDELKKKLGSIEEKGCPPCQPCPPCKEGWGLPRVNRGRTGIYI